MVYAILVFAFLFGFAVSCLLKFSSNWIDFPHLLCLQMTRGDDLATLMQRCLVCGEKITDSSTAQLLKSVGIIHMFVLSGAHLNFVIHWLKKIPMLKSRPLPLGIILFFITTMCGFQIPIVRAFLQLSFCQLSKSKKLFWSNQLAINLSGGCIALFTRQWSYSLILSWAAATFVESINQAKFKNTVFLNFYLYLGLFFFLLPLQPTHPIGVFVASVFTPLMSLILFPMTWLNSIFGFLTPLCQVVWSITLELLKSISPPVGTPPSWMPSELATVFLALLLFCKHKARKNSLLRGQK